MLHLHNIYSYSFQILIHEKQHEESYYQPHWSYLSSCSSADMWQTYHSPNTQWTSEQQKKILILERKILNSSHVHCNNLSHLHHSHSHLAHSRRLALRLVGQSRRLIQLNFLPWSALLPLRLLDYNPLRHPQLMSQQLARLVLRPSHVT